MGNLACFLRDGPVCSSPTPRRAAGPRWPLPPFALLDLTPYGRGEAWQDTPEGWPAGDGPCWYWRTDVDGKATWGATGRTVPQWTLPGATPAVTLGWNGDHG